MSIGNTSENNFMLLLFKATAWANVADNAAGTPLTNTHTALHTANPDETGTMSTSEAAYGSYGRVNVARQTGAGGWTITNNTANPAANIDFAQAASGSETESYFSVGKTGGGAADIFFYGTVTPNIAVATGVTPRLTTATAISID